MTGIDGYDWSPLGGSNPVPGDPDKVRTMGDQFSDLSSTVKYHNKLIKGIGSQTSEVWQGSAADAFHVKIKPLPGYLDKLTTSYDQAAAALHAYWPKLREAQTHAVQALTKARTAQATINATQTQLTGLQGQASDAGDAYNRLANRPIPAKMTPADHDTRQAALLQAQTNYQQLQGQVSDTQATLTSAQSDLSDAHTQCQVAVGMANTAADTCQASLSAASKAGIQNPHHSIWGTLAGGVEHVVGDVFGAGEHLLNGATHWAGEEISTVEHVTVDVVGVTEAAWNAGTQWMGKEATGLTDDVVDTAVHAWDSSSQWVSHQAVGLADTAVHDFDVAKQWGTDAVHATVEGWDATTHFVAAHAGTIETIAAVATLGPAGMLLTPDGRHLIHEGLEKAEPVLKVTSTVLGIATGVLGVASLLLAPFGVGEVLDGFNEGLMLAKTADDGLLVAAGDKDADADVVSDLIGVGTMGLGSATDLMTDTFKAGSEVAEKTAVAASKEHDLVSATNAATHADKDVELTEAFVGKGDALDAAQARQADANNVLTRAKSESADANKEVGAAQQELDHAKENFDFHKPGDYLSAGSGKTTMAKSLDFVKSPKSYMNGVQKDLPHGAKLISRHSFGRYYGDYFKASKGVVALRGAKTAYLTYDSATWGHRMAHTDWGFKPEGYTSLQMPDVAGHAVFPTPAAG